MEITVIMPLYNAEKYLHETLVSVLNQTFRHFELLCINDASTDTTADIIYEFAKKDMRIKILQNKERQGAAASRNKGIRAAKGKYLSFLDGDDIYEKEMLEKAYYACEEYNLDVIRFQGKEASSENIYCKEYAQLDNFYIRRYCTSPFSLQNLKAYEVRNWGVSPELELFRKSYIIANHLEYQTLPCCNDVYFVEMALLLANRMMVLDDSRIMAHFRQHQEPSRISIYRDPLCAYYALKKVQDELIMRNKFENYYQQFFYLFFKDMLSVIGNCKEQRESRRFYLFLQKEGIQTIIENGMPWFQKTDIYIKYIAEQFSKEYYLKWWENKNTILDILLMNHKEELVNLYIFCKKKGYKIALWGIGVNGHKIVEFCNNSGILLDAVVDKDIRKQGTFVEGYKIINPEELSKDIKIIIASNMQIYDENHGIFRAEEIYFWEIEQYFAEREDSI